MGYKVKRIYVGTNLVRPVIHVTGISLNQSSIKLTTAGQTSQLTATITPSDATNKNVTWTSSNTSIATVSSNGLVTGIAPGSCTITATTDNGLTATCSVSDLRFVPGANTLGYWTFDDRNANQITDFSGKGNNLTGGTMPTYTQVSGTNYAGNYANVSSGAVPNKSFGTMNEPMTVLVWVMVTATGQKYVSYFGTSSNAYQNSLIYGYNSGQFEYYEDKTKQGIKRVTIKSGVSLNTWYLIGYTRNGISVTTYCNGVAGGTTTGLSDTSNKTFYLGNSNAGGSERFSGKIGECVMENKVWTATEISNYYNLTKPLYGL